MKSLSIQTAVAALSAFFLCLPLHSHAEEPPKVDIKLIPSDGDTGNQHYSKSVELSLGPGHPAIISTNTQRGILAPAYFYDSKMTAPDSAILFGYSSHGSGTETLHVILIKRYDANTVVTDHLRITAPRGYCTAFYTKEGWLFAALPSQKLDTMEEFLKSRFFTVHNDALKTMRTFPIPKNQEPVDNRKSGPGRPVPPDTRTIRINIAGDRFTLAPWN